MLELEQRVQIGASSMKNRVVGMVLAALVLLSAAATLSAQERAGALDRPQREVLRAAPPQAGVKDASSRALADSRQQQMTTVLLVDDDWDYQFTAPGSQGGLPYYTSALDLLGLSSSVWDVQSQGQPDSAALQGHQAVIWFTGYAYSGLDQDPGVFTPENESAVAAYLDGGGNLLLSSQEYYADCCDNGPLTNFMKNYLGLLDVVDDVTATAVVGVAGSPIGDGLGPYAMARPDDYDTYWPAGIYEGPYDDEVTVQPVAGTPFAYASPWNSGSSAANYQGAGFKTLYLAWPLEWVDAAGERAQILGTALWWMGVSLPALADPVLEPIDNADGNAEYLVNWADVAGATDYVLEEDDDLDFGSAVIRYEGPESQFEVAQQELGTWHYRVRAHNPAADSGWSNTTSATVTVPAPPAPALAVINNPDHSVDFLVDWSDVAGATSYTLEEDEYEIFYSPEVTYAGAESFAQVTGHPGGTWHFRVRATSAGGSSVWSNVESVGVVPLAPVLRAIINPEGDGAYWVMWNASISATGYTLQEDDDPAFLSPMVRCPGAGNACPITGQPLGGWHYRVLAMNEFGASAWSDTQSTGVFSGAPVLAPIENGDGDHSYLVAWGGVGGATGYRLEEDSNPAFSSPVVLYAGAQTQYTVTGQSNGTWYYRVLAYNEGGVSPYSNIESVSLPVYLPLILRNP